jgi:general secretion pathway protein G
MLSGVPLGDAERPRVGSRGAVLRLTSPAGLGRIGRSHDSGIHNDLRALARALDRFRSERGSLPAASAVLAALSEVPGCLDEFLGALPHDPWGRPYAYQPEHPKRPGGFVLRSLGPDGEIDT